MRRWRGKGDPGDVYKARVADDFGRKDLQCHRSCEHRVAGAVDVSHPALPDQRLDLILAEGRADEIGAFFKVRGARHVANPVELLHSSRYLTRRALSLLPARYNPADVATVD